MTPFEMLGLPPAATTHEIKSRWRTLASQHHPDRGGDTEVFIRLRHAYTEALAEARRPKRCDVCAGTGRVPQARGFTTIQMPCKTCGGTGKLTSTD